MKTITILAVSLLAIFAILLASPGVSLADAPLRTGTPDVVGGPAIIQPYPAPTAAPPYPAPVVDMSSVSVVLKLKGLMQWIGSAGNP